MVVLLPLDDATRGFVDADLLGRLPDGALVVNVARGGVVDQDAVIAEAGRLRFALDVTDPEPLPDGHPLWSAPDVLITPHVAGGTTAMLPRIAALVRDQLQRYAAGDTLRNVVSGGDGPRAGLWIDQRRHGLAQRAVSDSTTWLPHARAPQVAVVRRRRRRPVVCRP